MFILADISTHEASYEYEFKPVLINLDNIITIERKEFILSEPSKNMLEVY